MVERLPSVHEPLNLIPRGRAVCVCFGGMRGAHLEKFVLGFKAWEENRFQALWKEREILPKQKMRKLKSTLQSFNSLGV